MRERGIHKGMGQKNSDWLVIPLAERYHTGAEGIHKIGVLEWEQRYGTQVSMLEMLSQLCGRDLFEAANQERKK